MKSINQTMGIRAFRMLVAATFLLSAVQASPVRAADVDLTITNATLSNPNPDPGETFDVIISVQNTGTEDTVGLIFRDVYVDRDPSMLEPDPESGCPPYGDYGDPSGGVGIPANSTDTRNIVVDGGLGFGVHQIWVYADPGCIEAETNETNNAFGPITVSIGLELVTVSVPSQDGWILESSEVSGKGGTMNSSAKTINLGDDAANRQYRAILSFDTSFLPEDAIIQSATLRLRYAAKTGTLPFSTHSNLLADIRKTRFGSSPALQVGDFQTGASKTKVLSFTSAQEPGQWYVRSLDPAYFIYIDLASTTQFRLRFTKDDNNDFGADLLKIYSGSATVVEYRPQFVIQYYVPTP